MAGDRPTFKHNEGFKLGKQHKQWPNIKLTLTCNTCHNRHNKTNSSISVSIMPARHRSKLLKHLFKAY